MPALVNARFLVPVFYALPLSRFRPTDTRRSGQGCTGQGAGRGAGRDNGHSEPDAVSIWYRATSWAAC
jgi:hypothetical protein